ncbi:MULTISPECIES: MarR family winged helix-turn-helix transcriptional regulator [unclassified Nocardia]|uniref:MarR family winged helix-turn-helix transcriptional regulator n=1 Tax=unclassified Nocardia TaxID=2637762 RepID=UPI00278BE569|nr:MULTISPECIES: MarR family transcriptional regulator [unclassified Nocardia]
MAVHRQRPPSLLAQPSYLASQVSKFGRQRLEAELAERGLRLGHQAVLSALDDFGPLSQQQLADALDLDKSHLVGHIDELQRRGLVTRAQDPADRRRNKIALTDAGADMVRELQPVAAQSQEGFLDALTSAEQQALTDLLRRVLAANDAERWGEP